MRSSRRILPPVLGLAILLGIGSARPSDRPSIAPYRQHTMQGDAIDWLEGQAEAHGVTEVIYKLNKKKEAPVDKIQKAEASARASLLELLADLRVDSVATLGSKEEAMKDLRALVQEAATTSTPPRLRSTMSVTVTVPLWGENGIVSLLIPPIENPDPHSTVTDLQPASSSPGEDAGTITTEEHAPVTGLVIDATHLTSAEPALFGRVIDETGRVIHSVEEADYEAVRDHGLMAYAIKLYSGRAMFRNWLREGDDPLSVEAVALGESSSDLVVSAADAERIRTADAGSGFLRQCRVLVLLPPTGMIQRKKKATPPETPRAPQENKPTGIRR